MPFKPRILRFDEEHPGVGRPAGGSTTMPVDSATIGPSASEGPTARTANDAPRTAPHDPTHDTVCGAEFDTIRDWDLDDALLADAQLQCLARQLSDDAARLAQRYPAEGWTPPVLEPGLAEPAATGSARTAVDSRHRWTFGTAARWLAAASVAAVVLALPPAANDGPASTAPTTLESTPAEVHESVGGGVPADALATDHRLRHVRPAANGFESDLRYEDGDTARWGPRPIDDSQFGPGGVGTDNLGNGRLCIDGFGIDGLPLEQELLKDLLPSDPHGYCEALSGTYEGVERFLPGADGSTVVESTTASTAQAELIERLRQQLGESDKRIVWLEAKLAELRQRAGHAQGIVPQREGAAPRLEETAPSREDAAADSAATAKPAASNGSAQGRQ